MLKLIWKFCTTVFHKYVIKFLPPDLICKLHEMFTCWKRILHLLLYKWHQCIRQQKIAKKVNMEWIKPCFILIGWLRWGIICCLPEYCTRWLILCFVAVSYAYAPNFDLVFQSLGFVFEVVIFQSHFKKHFLMILYRYNTNCDQLTPWVASNCVQLHPTVSGYN